MSSCWLNIMGLISGILNYFASDPIRLLQLLPLIGGGGGILWWLDRIKSRPRLCGRIIEERSPMAYRQLLKFEIENHSATPTSLGPKVMVTGYDPKGVKRRFEFDLGAEEIYRQEAQDRALPPYVPKKFSAIAWDHDEVYEFIFFKTFKFIPTKGRALKIRVRSLKRDQLPFFRFGFALMLYKLFKKTPFDSNG